MRDNPPDTEALESKLAFQEHTLQQLSDALIAQQERMDHLERWVELLAERVGDQEAGGAGGGGEPPPPHY